MYDRFAINHHFICSSCASQCCHFDSVPICARCHEYGRNCWGVRGILPRCACWHQTCWLHRDRRTVASQLIGKKNYRNMHIVVVVVVREGWKPRLKTEVKTQVMQCGPHWEGSRQMMRIEVCTLLLCIMRTRFAFSFGKQKYIDVVLIFIYLDLFRFLAVPTRHCVWRLHSRWQTNTLINTK